MMMERQVATVLANEGQVMVHEEIVWILLDRQIEKLGSSPCCHGGFVVLAS